MIGLKKLRTLNDSEFNRAVGDAAGWKFVLHSARNLPDYANNINAAWALFGGDGQMFGVSGGFGISECEARCADAHLLADVYVGNHAQPARALATAWYAWKIAQGDAPDL